MVSAKAWFSKAHNKTVKRTVEGVPTVETWEQRKKDIIAAVKEVRPEVTDDMFSLDESGNLVFGRNFWMKPKLKAQETGLFVVRSADYCFIVDDGGNVTEQYGNKNGMIIVSETIAMKKYDKGLTITFEIMN